MPTQRRRNIVIASHVSRLTSHMCNDNHAFAQIQSSLGDIGPTITTRGGGQCSSFKIKTKNGDLGPLGDLLLA